MNLQCCFDREGHISSFFGGVAAVTSKGMHQLIHAEADFDFSEPLPDETNGNRIVFVVRRLEKQVKFLGFNFFRG